MIKTAPLGRALAVALAPPSMPQKETVGQLGVEENGSRIVTHGFGERQAYAGNFALVLRAN